MMASKKKLSHRELVKADKDHQRAATAASLTYVNDSTAGIRREKKGKGVVYYYKDKLYKDAAGLERIRKLVIPPAWTKVWICASANGHIQATGYDVRNRKQYRYHPKWNATREETKFHRLYEFGKVLPSIRKQIRRDMRSKELIEEKVLATALSVMQYTYIRVGNHGYEKQNGSYGLTTLKDKHVTIKKDEIQFCFVGKKGIEHEIVLKNGALARIVKQCRDVPGKELFQYYDAAGKRKHIDSGMLNNYIKKASGSDFSAKDFRTWAGSLQALQCFQELGSSDGPAATKKNVLEMLDAVSSKLGNSRTICKKYYIHPGLIRLYEENKLIVDVPAKVAKSSASGNGLSGEEKVLLSVLKKCF